MKLKIPSEPAEWNLYHHKPFENWNLYHVWVQALPLYQIQVNTLKFNWTVYCATVGQSVWWVTCCRSKCLEWHTIHCETERLIFEPMWWPTACRIKKKPTCLCDQTLASKQSVQARWYGLAIDLVAWIVFPLHTALDKSENYI